MNKTRKFFGDYARRQKAWIGVVAGSGEGARSAVEADADFLLALNAGVYRAMGRGSLAGFLPYADANTQTERLLLEHILPHAGHVPVVAGVFASDQTQDVRPYLERLREIDVDAVTNFPSLGLIDGQYREALDEEGFGLAAEIEMLKTARAMGFVAFGFVFDAADVKKFLDAGVDALVLVMGPTRGVDDLREKRDQLQRGITRLNAMLAEVKASKRQVPCLAYGGAVTTPEDLEQLFRFCSIDGFAGGTAFERLPLRDIVSSMVRRFKSVAIAQQQPLESGLGQMVGRSQPMQELFTLIRRIAPYDVNVCIEGESGTGKELIATQLHRMSPRGQQAFVTLNCGAIPDTLLESELFGHEKGAFTGADRRRLGKFELAHRGTLFLDEIATLSAHGQVALLRAIQQREITRVGGDAPIAVDVRIVSASNQQLPQLVETGRFRADLFHRLNQITLQVPPLRQRLDDLEVLAADILARLQIQLNRKLLSLSPNFYKKLREHHWNGNVRELQHVILHAALREDGPVLEGRHFVPAPALNYPVIKDNSAKGGTAWQDTIRRALREHNGNKSRAAAALGVTRRTLYAWMKQLQD